MQIKDIIEAIQANSSDLEKPDIMAALVGYIADYYGLKNQKKQGFKWVSNRTSEIISSKGKYNHWCADTYGNRKVDKRGNPWGSRF